MEVRDGIKDHWVRDPDDPNDTRWEYTYHERLFTYSVPGIDELYNQIEVMACKLAQAPYTRRAQAITWKPWEDPFCHDPACLQSIWCRILPDTDGVWYLNTNVRMRSNDAYKAAFMNMFAFVKLQEKIADRVSEHAGREVRVGRYVHQADSYHIYGSYMEEVNNVFLKAITNRRFTDRTYRYDKMKPYMEEAIPSILEKAKKYKGE
jgi:thymidylate synthase